MYYHRTAVGTFLVVERFERWHVLFEDESLGSYANARQAGVIWPEDIRYHLGKGLIRQRSVSLVI
jgi:hypothetical protein